VQEREADHSPPCNSEVKNVGAIPQILYMSSWLMSYLIKYNTSSFILAGVFE
jgi:hypothetical protein